MRFRIAGPEDYDALLCGALRAYGARIRDLQGAAQWAVARLSDSQSLVLTGADEAPGETVLVASVFPYFYDPSNKEHVVKFIWSHTGRIHMLDAMLGAAVQWAISQRAKEHIFNPPPEFPELGLMAKRNGFTEVAPVYLRRTI